MSRIGGRIAGKVSGKLASAIGSEVSGRIISAALGKAQSLIASNPDLSAKVGKVTGQLSGIGGIGDLGSFPDSMASGVKADPTTAMSHANQLKGAATGFAGGVSSTVESAVKE